VNSERVKASPLARRVAKDAGVDLSSVKGSGPGGRIVKADVEGAEVPAVAPAPQAGETETAKGSTTYQDLSRLQQVVSRRMAESKATAPHFYLQAEIDMSAAVEARGRLKALTPEGEVVPSFNDMVVKACALALREHPLANGSYKDGRFELYSRVNVGIAVAAQDALVVPTVFDADRKGLREIAEDARSLAAKVRDGSITPPELSGGTFTVSNLGMYGVSNFSAVINAPQAAILAVGAITERPVVREGQVATAHLLGVTLACDHRILYGAPAAEFLARIRGLLEEPLSLAL
jgi:pyruvate dehydrogenase E2 component (dihydrolipoamide acetyltransferase)